MKKNWPIGEEIWCDGDTKTFPEIAKLPYYHQVPKEKLANLAYRSSLIHAADGDAGYQRELIKACRQDPLFWLNTFCFLFEPRPRPQVLPCILWKHQETFVWAMYKYLGHRDIGILKSRGEGASWMAMLLFLHQFIFEEEGGVGPAFGVASRNEDAVDKANDPDALFWKIDFALSKLPQWMVPWWNRQTDRSNSNHTFINRKTNATIIGYSATGDLGTGGRKVAWFFDELSKFLTIPQQQNAMNSTQHTTECRILCSTPKGDIGAFYDAMTKPSSMLKLVVHWTCNDNRKQGLYQSDKAGRLRKLDKGFEYDDSYPYIRDGKLRSPWYDGQCSRPGATPASIAQELDLDFGGSTYKFFDVAIEKGRQTCQSPVVVGEVDYDDGELVGTFVKQDRGRLQLWRYLTDEGHFEPGDYVVACDVASGTSGQWVSNSVLQVVDRKTGEQVAEWVSSGTLPHDFAFMSVAICRWIERSPGCSAFLIWDSLGGPGSQYTQAVIEQTTYRNIYFSNPKREMEQVRGKRKPRPGYGGRDPEKLLGRLRDRIIRGLVVVKSEGLVQELSEWEFRAGKLIHVPSATSDDESAKGLAHGDRVMALGIALVGCLDRPLAPKPTKPREVPYGCLAWREKRWDEADLKAELVHEFAWD